MLSLEFLIATIFSLILITSLVGPYHLTSKMWRYIKQNEFRQFSKFETVQVEQVMRLNTWKFRKSLYFYPAGILVSNSRVSSRLHDVFIILDDSQAKEIDFPGLRFYPDTIEIQDYNINFTGLFKKSIRSYEGSFTFLNLDTVKNSSILNLIEDSFDLPLRLNKAPSNNQAEINQPNSRQ